MGQEVARVVSAVKLGQEKISDLQRTLSKIRGKKIIIENHVDESIIGGMRIEIGSFLYDGSVRGFLRKFTEKV